MKLASKKHPVPTQIRTRKTRRRRSSVADSPPMSRSLVIVRSYEADIHHVKVACHSEVPGVDGAAIATKSTFCPIIATPGAASPSNVHLGVADFNAVSKFMAPSDPADAPTG
jgi:hypothetical protein